MEGDKRGWMEMEERSSGRAPPHLFTDGAHTPQVAPAGVGAGPYPYVRRPPVPLHRGGPEGARGVAAATCGDSRAQAAAPSGSQ